MEKTEPATPPEPPEPPEPLEPLLEADWTREVRDTFYLGDVLLMLARDDSCRGSFLHIDIASRLSLPSSCSSTIRFPRRLRRIKCKHIASNARSF